MLAGAFATIGTVVLLMIVGVLVTPKPSVAARMMVETLTTTETGTVASTISLRTNSVIDALATLARRNHDTTTYTTRGNSIYLVETLGRVNGQGGIWSISVNGDLVTDLGNAKLENGDELRVIWHPQP